MSLDDGGWFGTPNIVGRRQGFSITIQPGARGYEVTIEGLAKIPQELSLERRLSGEAGILTGDTAFDLTVRVLGAEAKALALLDHDTRKLVRRHVSYGGATVDNGRLSCGYRALQPAGDAIPGLLELAGRLVIRHDEAPARLAANVLNDPLQDVRARSLQVLLDQFFEDEITVGVCHKILESHSDASQDRLRLQVAISLADTGLDTVCDMALHAATDELRVQAIEHLTRPSWAEQALPVMEQLIYDLSIPVINAAITAIGRFRHRPAVPRLLAMLRADRSPMTEASVKALTRIGDASVEGSLLPLLSSDDLGVLAATIEALAFLGSWQAVEPLLQLAKAPGRNVLRQQIRAAVERIQGRLKDAEKGQLSLAATQEHEGALSPPEGSAEGAVSLTSTSDRR
jgi:hypothetical protein